MVIIALIIVLIIVIIVFVRSRRTKSLYDRLGGVYSIAAVVNHFSDALVNNPIVGRDSPNEKLRDWHRNQLTRLPGLKFMRTLWLCDVAGGPYTFVPTRAGCPFAQTAAMHRISSARTSLQDIHVNLDITPIEFDEVGAELGRSLDYFGVPAQEKNEVLAAFAGHKHEVIV
jgi:hemoglobin